MRINEITNWAYGITVVLTVLSGGAFIMSSRSAAQERAAIEERQAFDELADALELGAEMRSDAARSYVMTGEQRHLQAFRGDESEEHRLEKEADAIRSRGAAELEIAALADIERDADALDKLEEDAVALPGGSRTDASGVLFGAEHERLETALAESVNQFRQLVSVRTASAVRDAQARSDQWSLVAKIMLGVTAALFLGVLYFILRRRVAMPLMRMSGIVTRLARQDYAVEVPHDARRDEIGDMHQAIHVFRDNALERDRLDAERRAEQHTKDLILQMMHRLQACLTQPELAEVVSLFAPQIFPKLAGRFFVLNDSRTLLTPVGAWLDPQQPNVSFSSSACWGVRRGRPHLSNHHQDDVPCPHLDGALSTCLCVPLTAQGDAIGLLCFEEGGDTRSAVEGSRLYLELIAENIGLAVANLQLRDRLMNLAVRDALTGLLNRRCLDEALARAERDDSGKPLSCLMMDIDLFKRFNDEFGHDAGDKVMQYVAQIMLDVVKETGNCYRFGGEEFTVLLPGCGGPDAFEVAERLREKIATAPLSHGGRILGMVSVSIGVAEAGSSQAVANLLTRADSALLGAKASGRNRSMLAGSTGRTEQNAHPSA
ncbi:diguanylate cyclase [Neorhizobium lilium]|uniref:diguanylate cyclase n=1 Tax=Neorhizobium lilium TaxID=2503024 RepID=A0A444LJ86_9HYPH|nr:sensor domain-containing diguanylate cyclase [Neorhizobium lilium]RWX79015.1 diguanylate cyclase [Neorhizobium lilium]